MKETQAHVEELVRVFEKTFEDKIFSRAEKQAMTQLLEQDYELNKEQRDYVRNRLFDIAKNYFSSQHQRDIIEWLEKATKLLQRRHDSSVCFSPGEGCRDIIVGQLKKALTSVDICVFTISDNFITEEILNCLDRKLKIRIITDDEKVFDKGSDIRKLSKAGIEVLVDASPHHMHHKFAIFDHQRIITGSYNWTRSASAHNQENVFLTDDKKVVGSFQEEFRKLWDTMVPLKNHQR
jgi:cardiolipin hydrolase